MSTLGSVSCSARFEYGFYKSQFKLINFCRVDNFFWLEDDVSKPVQSTTTGFCISSYGDRIRVFRTIFKASHFHFIVIAGFQVLIDPADAGLDILCSLLVQWLEFLCVGRASLLSLSSTMGCYMNVLQNPSVAQELPAGHPSNSGLSFGVFVCFSFFFCFKVKRKLNLRFLHDRNTFSILFSTGAKGLILCKCLISLS